MKGFFSALILFFCIQIPFAQTYELTGNPINTSGWTLVSDAVAEDDFIKLTPDVTWKVGAVKLNEPINLNYCEKWTVEFDFRIDGNGTADLRMGDGLAFWYLVNPPANYELGAGMGIPQNSVGLMIGFDTFNNTNNGQMSKIHVLYGSNPGNIEFNDTAGSSYHSPDLNATHPFVGSTYKHVKVTGEKDAANPGRTRIQLWLDGTLLVNQSLIPAGAAATMTNGYFGFSASTGGATSRHSVKNVKVYVDRVPVLQQEFQPNLSCPDYEDGSLTFDLTQFENQMVSNPENYSISYVDSQNGNVITNPENYTFSENKIIYVIIADPSTTLCNAEVKIRLNGNFIKVKDAPLESCGLLNSAVFNLSDAEVTTESNTTKEYYLTLSDLLSGNNKILDFAQYETSDFSDVYVKIIHSSGCFRYAKIQLIYHEGIVATDDELQSCSESPEISEAVFNLSEAEVTAAPNSEIRYFKHENDAIQNMNAIPNPETFLSPSTTVFARVSNSNGCFDVAEIKLIVSTPIRISRVQVEGNQIFVETVGGQAPLYYSLNGIDWQTSHVLTFSEGGSHTIFVKDDFGCNIAEYSLVILTIPNVITPNNDGFNDEIDFSLLTSKNNFSFKIFDRYGAMVFSGKNSNSSIWKGVSQNGKLLSGTYWYIVSWNEQDDFSTFMKYTGWILVKNR